jgi:hypothetical protein
MNVKETKLINTETGEVLSQSTKNIDYFDNEKGYLLFARKNYSRVFNDIRIPKDFNDSELGKIYRLQEHIQQSTNMMIKRTKRGYRPMSLDEMVQLTNLSDRFGKEFIKKMITHKLIARVTVETGERTTVQYYFNPLYFHNDKRLSVMLYNLFKEEIDPYINLWVKIAFKEANTLL